MDDVVILPADKGNATVVMSKEEYDRKIMALLDTPTYRKLPRDPTASQENKISRTLLKLKKDKKLPLRVYDRLRPSGPQPPRIYGLPKIHKPDVPLRPIVSCINSPTYRLSQHISTLIPPLAGHTETAVKNSAALVEELSHERVTQDELLVSFDVSSLFTNVPVPEAVEVIREMLKRDPKLSERTTLDADTIADLLSLCLKSTYFRYNSCYYEQKEGAAMGSPVSAVVANLYMEHFEQIALNSALHRPRLWKRYVDDTLCILGNGEVDELLLHINSIRPSIKFTVETEKDGSLPFLDTLVSRGDSGMLSFSVYRKPTHTDRYLHFNSHHPTHVKRGLVKCLFNRAKEVTSGPTDLVDEHTHITNALVNNGYPRNFVRSCSVLRHRAQADQERPLTTIAVPYVAGLSEDIRRVCRQYNIRVAFRSGRSLRSMLTRVKDPLPPDLQSKVIYKVPCSCGKAYIGETTRRLETRLKEHRDACIKQLTDKSAIAEHAWNSHCPIKWEEASVLDHARNPPDLMIKEAIHIQTTPLDSLINRDKGAEIPGCWVATINAHAQKQL